MRGLSLKNLDESLLKRFTIVQPHYGDAESSTVGAVGF
jgi:hypothetical protein